MKTDMLIKSKQVLVLRHSARADLPQRHLKHVELVECGNLH